MLNPGLDVVGNDGLRNAGHKLQGTHMGIDPAGQVLTLRGLGKGVAAGAEDGDKNRRLVEDAAGLPVMNRDLVAGVVDKHLFARAVLVPQDHIQCPRPVVIPLTKTAIAVAFRVPLPILLPQELQSEIAVGLQLPADCGKVGLRGLARLPTRPRPSEKSLLPLLLIPFRRQRPAQSSLRGSLQVLMYGALSDRAATRDLPLLESEGMESKNFFEFAHTEPFLRQWIPPLPSEGPYRAFAQRAELFLIKPLRHPDHHSEHVAIFHRHRVGIVIDISS